MTTTSEYTSPISPHYTALIEERLALNAASLAKQEEELIKINHVLYATSLLNVQKGMALKIAIEALREIGRGPTTDKFYKCVDALNLMRHHLKDHDDITI